MALPGALSALAAVRQSSKLTGLPEPLRGRFIGAFERLPHGLL